ncbi:MAG: hypothetical protein AAFU85_10755 [Planctomycetota bacterium]
MLELAVDHFAEQGKEELITWEFGSSSDLGRFIFELASLGSIELSESDRLDDFAGWYDLEQSPETWKLRW